MTPNEYQEAAARTISALSAINMTLGLCGESGEVAEIIKKYTYHHHPLDKEHLMKELGDVAWYLAGMCTVFGFPLEGVMEMNIEKLKKRYPTGFSTDDSINRKE